MTPEVILLLLIILVMIVLFITEKMPIDLTAFCGLTVVTLLGYLTPKEAFSGFSSPAVITLLSMFILGVSLTRTGIAENVADKITEFTGNREIVNVIVIMLMSAFLSAFMSNVAVVAVLLPAAASIAVKTSIPPSRLLLPLSFAAILGGMTTEIGTPPNILINVILQDSGLEPFKFYDFTPFGLAAVIFGTIFIAFWGRLSLPKRDVSKGARERSGDLTRIYRIFELLFTLKIPTGSSLIGKTLIDSRIGTLLRVRVVSILRKGAKILNPRPDQILEENDLLIAQGRISRFKDLQRFKGIKVEEFKLPELGELPSDFVGGCFEIIEGDLIGSTLRDSRFREQHNAVAVGIERQGSLIYKSIGSKELKEGDVLHVIGRRRSIDKLVDNTDFIHRQSVPVQEVLHEHLFAVLLPEGSALNGISVKDSRIGELIGVQVFGISRGDNVSLAPGGGEVLHEQDKLLIVGEPHQITKLSQLGTLEVESVNTEEDLESEEVAVFEVLLSPRSNAIGKTLMDLNFRDKYGIQVMAIWRGGRPYRTNLASIPLQFGDALLLHGPRSKIDLLLEDADFVVFSNTIKAPRRTEKSLFAVLGLLFMILSSLFGLLPVHVAAFSAATFVILFGAVRMEEVYKEVTWRIIFLVAAVLPLGIAVKNSGGAEVLGGAIVSAVGGFGPYAVFIVIGLLASLVSQGLEGSVSVVLLAPVAIKAAEQMQISPYPILMVMTLSASVAFLTPFSHRANLLVMGAGGYRGKDYLKIGGGLTAVVFIALFILIPLFFPF